MNDISKKIKETYRIVNFLLSKNLDEKFSDSFDLAAELELPVGVSRFGDKTKNLATKCEIFIFKRIIVQLF